MGRHSKLTEKQWFSVEKRMLEGESNRKLAEEFGVTEAAIRKRFGAQKKQIVSVANQMLETNRALKALPISAQIGAQNLFQRLLSISEHIANAAEYGAKTAHKLSLIANIKAEEIDDSATLVENAESLKSVMAFTKAANDASQIGINILAANKDRMKEDDSKEVTVVVRNSRSGNV